MNPEKAKIETENRLVDEETKSSTEFDVNKNLGDQAGEITKEVFFKNLYNPAEKESSKKYKIRGNLTGEKSDTLNGNEVSD